MAATGNTSHVLRVLRLLAAVSLFAGCRSIVDAVSSQIDTVVTLDGTPVSGVGVIVRTSTGLYVTVNGRGDHATQPSSAIAGSTSGGVFTLEGLPPGTYTVSIRPPEGATCTPEEHTLQLIAGDRAGRSFGCLSHGSVTGSVTVNAGPESGVNVQLQQGTVVVATTPTNADGSFVFDNVPVGVYTVRINTPQNADCPTTDRPVNVTSKQTTTVPAFVCTRPTTGTIVVLVLSGGSPVAGANVKVTGTAQTVTISTASDGRAAFPDLQPELYAVSVAAQGQACPPTTATVVAGQTTNRTVTCAAFGIVTGVVTVNGSPEAGVQVTILSNDVEDWLGITRVTSSTGTYVFQDNPPGSYSVHIVPPPGATCPTVQQTAVVVSNQTTIVPDFACTRDSAPTPPTGAQIAGNWSYARVFESESGACGAQLPGAGAGTMTFNASNNVIFATGFDPDNGVSGPYNQSTGGWTGTGTRFLSGGITLQTTVTGIYGLSSSVSATFGGTMTQRYSGNSNCMRTYNVSGVRGN